LPNPHFVPEFRNKTDLIPVWQITFAAFRRTGEFLDRVTELMLYHCFRHYVQEGKSYTDCSLGCTGGIPEA